MNRAIWKFVLPIQDTAHVLMPVGAVPLCVAEQHGELCLWAEVDPTAPGLAHTFLIRGTGNPFTGVEGAYLGTAQIGVFVWHIYELARMAA